MAVDLRHEGKGGGSLWYLVAGKEKGRGGGLRASKSMSLG
jgi:hypothetical protein